MITYKNSVLQAVISKFVADRDTELSNIEKIFLRDSQESNFDVVSHIQKVIGRLALAEYGISTTQKYYAMLNNIDQLNDLTNKAAEIVDKINEKKQET